ncbi:chemotaxis protein CheW [Candidatus Poribacteria bacterium]|nr:chemotaxis protein CheW [Candidatus Poribacteria bacterium]
MKQTEIQETGQELQLVGFKLSDEQFGVEILCVREIIRVVSITRVPRAPGFVEGIINLRGEVIPVIDLRKRLNLESREFDNSTRLIVVELNDQQIGFIVDSVSQVLRVPADAIEEPPEMVTGIDSEFILGVTRIDDGERLLLILDLKRILSQAEQVAMERVA